MSTVDNSQDTLDSRDVTARMEELGSELQDLQDAMDGLEEGDDQEAFDDAEEDFATWNDENLEELEALQALVSEADCSPDWIHGETLIADDYFTDYIKDMVEDCYPLDLDSLPDFVVIEVDWEATADNCKMDYMSVDFDGSEYWIRA